MKTTFSKILSLLLVLTSLVSVLGIFAGAADAGEGGQEETPIAPYVYFNRNFDDGWDYNNGAFVKLENNTAVLESETNDNLKTNHYVKMTATNDKAGYLQYDFDNFDVSGTLILSVSLKVCDNVDIGDVITMKDGAGSTTTTLVTIKADTIGVLGGSITLDTVKPDQWYNIDIIVDLVNKTTEALVNGNSIFTGTYGSVGAKNIAIGFQKGASKIGTSFCFDNLSIYRYVWNETQFPNDPPKSVKIDRNLDGYGKLVQTTLDKTIKVDDDGKLTNKEAFDASLIMKVGVNQKLDSGKKSNIFNGTYGAPAYINGVLYVPVDPIIAKTGATKYYRSDYTSLDIASDNGIVYLTAGRDRATINSASVDLTAAPVIFTTEDSGYMMIAMDDVEKLFDGWFVTYDDMGLIVIAQLDNCVNRKDNLDEMLDCIREFVYDMPDSSAILADFAAKSTQHPRLIMNQTEFDALVALAAQDDTLKGWVTALVALADNAKSKYLDGEDLKADTAPASISLLYTAQGKIVGLTDVGDDLLNLAFAYQMTKDQSYATLAYKLIVSLGELTHWGPGNAEDCADLVANVALAYDWLYNAFESLGLDNGAVADILYEKGVHAGYLSAVKDTCLYKVSASSTAYAFTTSVNARNAAASSGMMIGALAIMGVESYRQEAADLAATLLTNLPTYGLDIYAPDGALIESATAWNNATNGLFRMCAALYSACGKDYGIMNAPGLDNTCVFAAEIESSDYDVWLYHEGVACELDTSMFGFYASYAKDKNIAALRYEQIARGKQLSVFDAIFFDLDAKNYELSPLPLDYCFDGLGSFVTRSSWESGAIYAGLHGGDNSETLGDLDAGNFIYVAEGVTWVADLGADNTALYGYYLNDTIRYHYYRKGVEGQNVVFVPEFPGTYKNAYGQFFDNNAQFYNYYSDENGSFALLDNKYAYNDIHDTVSGTYVSYARRGAMLTNSRKTFVIQDEISLVSIGSLVWIAHVAKNVVVDQSGRNAYMTAEVNGKTVTVRAAIVTPSKAFKFEKITAGDQDLILNTTYTADEVAALLATQAQNPRDEYAVLCIRAEQVLSFELSVVFEVIDPENETDPAYSYTAMDQWLPYSTEQWKAKQAAAGEKDRTKSAMADIRTACEEAETYILAETQFGADRDAYYLALTDMWYPIEVKYGRKNLADAYLPYADKFIDYEDEYERLVEKENTHLKSFSEMALSLLGANFDTAE